MCHLQSGGQNCLGLSVLKKNSALYLWLLKSIYMARFINMV